MRDASYPLDHTGPHNRNHRNHRNHRNQRNHRNHRNHKNQKRNRNRNPWGIYKTWFFDNMFHWESMAKFSAILGFQPAPNPSSCPWRRRPFQEGHLQVPFLPKIFHLCKNRGSAGVPISDFWLGGMDTAPHPTCLGTQASNHRLRLSVDAQKLEIWKIGKTSSKYHLVGGC